MHPITIGTCGWSYKDWQGVLYPEHLGPADYLSYYAEKYPIVEVDSTFYRLPSLRMVQGWNDQTPDGFRFSLKVPQVITHEKLLVDCQEEAAAFWAAVRLLGEKLRCAVLQFGYFNRQAFAGQAAFLERLDPFLAKWPADVPVAVEIRNKSWMSKYWIDELSMKGQVCIGNKHRAALDYRRIFSALPSTPRWFWQSSDATFDAAEFCIFAFRKRDPARRCAKNLPLFCR